MRTTPAMRRSRSEPGCCFAAEAGCHSSSTTVPRSFAPGPMRAWPPTAPIRSRIERETPNPSEVAPEPTPSSATKTCTPSESWLTRTVAWVTCACLATLVSASAPARAIAARTGCGTSAAAGVPVVAGSAGRPPTSVGSTTRPSRRPCASSPASTSERLWITASERQDASRNTSDRQRSTTAAGSRWSPCEAMVSSVFSAVSCSERSTSAATCAAARTPCSRTSASSRSSSERCSVCAVRPSAPRARAAQKPAARTAMAGIDSARGLVSRCSPWGSPLRGAIIIAAASTTPEIPPTRGPRQTVKEATSRPAAVVSADQTPTIPMLVRRNTRLIRQPALVTTTSHPGGGDWAPSGPSTRRTPMTRQKVPQTRHTRADASPAAISPSGGRRTEVTAWPRSSRMTIQ